MALDTTEYDLLNITSGKWSDNGNNPQMNNIYLVNFSINSATSVTFGAGTALYIANRFTKVLSNETVDFPSATGNIKYLFIKYNNTTKDSLFITADSDLSTSNDPETISYYEVFRTDTSTSLNLTNDSIIWNASVGEYLSKNLDGSFLIEDDDFNLYTSSDAEFANHARLLWNNKNVRIDNGALANGSYRMRTYDKTGNSTLDIIFENNGNIYSGTKNKFITFKDTSLGKMKETILFTGEILPNETETNTPVTWTWDDYSYYEFTTEDVVSSWNAPAQTFCFVNTKTTTSAFSKVNNIITTHNIFDVTENLDFYMANMNLYIKTGGIWLEGCYFFQLRANDVGGSVTLFDKASAKITEIRGYNYITP